MRELCFDVHRAVHPAVDALGVAAFAANESFSVHGCKSFSMTDQCNGSRRGKTSMGLLSVHEIINGLDHHGRLVDERQIFRVGAILCHSYRKVWIGSTRVARLAGI